MTDKIKTKLQSLQSQAAHLAKQLNLVQIEIVKAEGVLEYLSQNETLERGARDDADTD